ncbi:MAG: 2-octaprenyl-6-methoxyphenyl hydroxylase [Pseudomonadota bacterium]
MTVVSGSDTAGVPASVDVAILGGGMVGASLAVALAPLRLSIAVIEAREPGKPGQPSYDDRSTAVSLGSQRILDTMGVWDSLTDTATAIRRIHVSDRGRFGATRLDSREEGVPALGYVIENRVLGRALWKRLQSTANVHVVCPATLTGVRQGGSSVQIDCAVGDEAATLGARLAVAADGAQSRARELAGIGVSSRSYEQSAVITNVTTQERHDGTAFERFTDEGPLAFLPMSNGRCSVVWTMASERVDGIMGLSDADFLAALQQCFGYRLGRLLKCGERHAYPLSLMKADEIVDERLALVGNAAHGLHPVAGQGFNLGLRDVAALADVVADVVADSDEGAGDTLGGETMLRQYAHWRRDDQSNVVTMTDGLVRTFTNPFPPVRAARGLALVALDALPPARRLFARRAMGLEGRLPRLARGVSLG